MIIKRAGIDHDPVMPWMWATLPLRTNPVEILSYPIPHEDADGVIDERATIMIRMTPGDPTTLKEVSFRAIACFHPSRHEDYYKD